jgi:transcription elongation factor Elf1
MLLVIVEYVQNLITVTYLVIHAHRHAQLFRCGICGRTFESVESFKEHLHFQVASTGSLSCYICGICFTEDEEVLLEEQSRTEIGSLSCVRNILKLARV